MLRAGRLARRAAIVASITSAALATLDAAHQIATNREVAILQIGAWACASLSLFIVITAFLGTELKRVPNPIAIEATLLPVWRWLLRLWLLFVFVVWVLSELLSLSEVFSPLAQVAVYIFANLYLGLSWRLFPRRDGEGQ